MVTCRTDHKFLPNVHPHTAHPLHMPFSLLWTVEMEMGNAICRLRWIPPLPLISTRPPLGSLITIHPVHTITMPCVNQIMNAVATTDTYNMQYVLWSCVLLVLPQSFKLDVLILLPWTRRHPRDHHQGSLSLHLKQNKAWQAWVYRSTSCSWNRS